MTQRHCIHMLGGSAALALLAHSSAALAQQGQPEQQSEQIEEITVTARSRSENVQKVPDAITALSATAIENRGIKAIADVIVTIPNLSIAEGQNPGTVTMSVRGVSQVRNGEAPVAIVIDGVQLSSPNQITQELYDVERIEVLKGPQGALYGRNAIAGAINIVTKKPTNEFEGSVTGEYANGNDIKLRATASGPIVPDLLLFRASLGYQHFDGVLTNEFLDRKVDFRKEVNGRARLLYTPTDRLTVDLRGAYSDLRSGLSYYVALPDGMANNSSIPIQADRLGKGYRKLGDVSLKIDYELGGGKLTSITAYSKVHEFLYEDLDWTPVSILELSQDLRVRSISQELRYTSDSSKRLRYIAGAYFLGTHRDLDTQLYINFGAGPAPIAPTQERNKNRAWAGFGQLAFDVTPELELTAALRYDNDHRRQFDPGTGVARSKDFNAWQPKFSARYTFSDALLLYATYAKGFRSGGFNAPTAAFPPIFKAEGTTNYEAGFKSTLLDRRVQINGAAFMTDFKNQQVFLLDGFSGAQGVVNIDKVRIKGAEMDLTARPLPGVDFNAGIGFIDTDIRNFDGTALYIGNRTPYVYRWSFNVGAQYSHRLADDWTLRGRIDYSRKSGEYFHVDNADQQTRVELVDARLTLEHGPIQLTAFAKNLFNEKYSVEFFAREFIGTAADIRWPNEPRRYGLQAKYSF